MAHPSRAQADLHLRVRRVIKVSKTASIHSRALGSIRSILCECEEIGSNANPEQRVLFSFEGSVTFSRLWKDREALREGAEVLLWKPWENVKTSTISTMLCYRFAVAPNSD